MAATQLDSKTALIVIDLQKIVASISPLAVDAMTDFLSTRSA